MNNTPTPTPPTTIKHTSSLPCPACEEIKREDEGRADARDRMSVTQFLEWCRIQGWTLMASNGFNCFIPEKLYDPELNISAGSSLSVELVLSAYYGTHEET